MGKKESGEVRQQRKSFFQAAQSGDLEGLPRGLRVRPTTSDKESGDLPEPAQTTWCMRSLVQPASSDTVLHVAARNGHLNVIRFFLDELELDHLLTSANQDGKCPLHEAAQSLQCEVSQYLIDRGTSVDILKRADWTPLMLACTRDDNGPMIKLLLQNGARTALRNKDGWTPFHIGTRKGNLESLKILLAHNPSLSRTKSNNGRTPLHTAAVHGHTTVVSFLLSTSSDPEGVDVQDSCGSTPLMDAARFNSVDCCKMLIHHGATIDKRDGVGRNALHVAAQAGSTEVVQFLLGAMDSATCRVISIGLELDGDDELSTDSAHRRHNTGDVATANWRTDNGQTALHLAAREGHVATVKYLLSVGANIEATDRDGCTAIDIAGKYQSDHTIEILKGHRDESLELSTNETK